MSPQEQYWFALILIDVFLGGVFISSLLWARARKPIGELPDPAIPGFSLPWICNHCGFEVKNYRCKCKKGPSPWEPPAFKAAREELLSYK